MLAAVPILGHRPKRAIVEPQKGTARDGLGGEETGGEGVSLAGRRGDEGGLRHGEKGSH